MTPTTFILWLALGARAFALSPIEVAFIVGDDPRAECRLVRVTDSSIEIPYCTMRNDTDPRIAAASPITYAGLRLAWSR